MEPRTLHLLEFPKVLEYLSERALSEPGASACLQLEPISDSDARLAHNGRLREFLDLTARSPELRPAAFPSLDGLFSFMNKDSAPVDLDALWALKQVLNLSDALRKNILKAVTGALSTDDALASLKVRYPHMHRLFFFSAWPERSYAALRRCLNNEGNLKDESSPELLAARSEIRAIHQRCAAKAKDFILEHALGQYVQEDYITISSDRYVLPLKSNFKNRWPGIIHDYSQTGETCYFEPLFLVDLNNNLQELHLRERRAELEVLKMISGLATREMDGLKAAYQALVELDVIQAKAALTGQGFSLIDPDPAAELRLTGARHPLLVLAGQKSVPVDIELADGRRALVISGGNAGGKTVCLKTCGLIALMAACSIPVPADEGSTLPDWSKIFVFMGDEQSLEDHASTFTGQIRYLSGLWSAVDGRTLIILDEFGSGTDPTQGAALAQALIDELVEQGAWTLCATHFPALKAYALTRPGVRSATVMFDPASKRPLYTLGYDQAGASQALDVAREEGLPEAIMKRAEQYLLLDATDSAEVMDRLNSLAVDKSRELKELKSLRRRLEDKSRRLKEIFAQERQVELDRLRTRSREIYDDWRLGRLAHKQAMGELATARRELAEQQAAEQAQAERAKEAAAGQALAASSEFEVGQGVFYRPWKRQGVIEAYDRKKDQYKIGMQGVSIWSRASDLGIDARPGPSASAGQISAPKPRDFSFTLDLRGQRADEALDKLAVFLDDAIRHNLTQVEIIHGRGMGALRREVHAFLNSFPFVANFRLAPEDQGGDGKTIVDLKE